MSKLLANKVRIIDKDILKSWSVIAINSTNIAQMPPNFTMSSLCLVQPIVKAIKEVGKIKYSNVSWNSCDVKKASSM